MESDGSHDCQFTTCVIAFNIRCGISFRITQICSQFQRIIKFHAVFSHFGQDKVCGTIDDTHYFCDIITQQALLHGANDGNTTGNSCFKEQVTLMLSCNFQQFMPMSCHQVFVCSYDMFAFG